MTKNEKIQIVFLFLIGLLIFVLIVAIIVFVDNAEEVRLEPVQYAIENTDLQWCTCGDSINRIVNYPRVEDGSDNQEVFIGLGKVK